MAVPGVSGATTIARVAHALCTDVVSATVVAARCPVLVVPSMNEAMYRSPAVQRNLELLRRDGRHITLPGVGSEVAWQPADRTPRMGPAPPPGQVVAAVELILSELLARRATTPATGEAWDRQYDTTPLSDLPWYTEELDADLSEAIRAVARGRLLDVGTGPGTAAIFAARQGHDVVATDVSRAALTAARQRAAGLPIAWMLDDATDSRLWGRFDVAVDRGCLHTLPRSVWPRYADAASRWVAPGAQGAARRAGAPDLTQLSRSTMASHSSAGARWSKRSRPLEAWGDLPLRRRRRSRPWLEAIQTVAVLASGPVEGLARWRG